MVRRDGSRHPLPTRNGNDWADRFPSIVKAAASFEVHSLIDDEAVICPDDGMPDFRALRSKRRVQRRCCMPSTCCMQHDGAHLRDLSLIERKRRLGRLLGRAKRQAIQFVGYLTGDGPTAFRHVMGWRISCRSGLRPIEAGHQGHGSSRRTRTWEDRWQKK